MQAARCQVASHVPGALCLVAGARWLTALALALALALDLAGSGSGCGWWWLVAGELGSQVVMVHRIVHTAEMAVHAKCTLCQLASSQEDIKLMIESPW